jgi:peptide/nickel transport system permease protein
MGLNRPIPAQYWEWFTRLLSGDWGHSYRDGQPVLWIIGSHLTATLELMIASASVAVAAGMWVGVLGAIRRYSLFDYLATVGAMIALSIPTFWFGLVTIYLFSVKLAILPAGNMYTIGNGSFFDYVHHLIAPALVLGLVTVALWSRYMRSSMLEVINQDYIRTARAKGLAERVVVYRHAMRNTMVPLLTSAGIILGGLLSNTFVVETLFNIPGLGRLAIDSIFARDYPVAMAVVILFTLFFAVINLAVDVLYSLIDPRIRGRMARA